MAVPKDMAEAARRLRARPEPTDGSAGAAREAPEAARDPSDLRATTVAWLSERGVTVRDIAEIVLDIQGPFYADLTIEDCEASIERVIEKREVQHAVITGITLDVLAEQGLLPEPLQSVVMRDEALFGIDEILALSITNVYGSIGLTNFGFLDKEKLGVIGRLNGRHTERCHTFLDDLIAGIAAAAAARIAHTRGRE